MPALTGRQRSYLRRWLVNAQLLCWCRGAEHGKGSQRTALKRGVIWKKKENNAKHGVLDCDLSFGFCSGLDGALSGPKHSRRQKRYLLLSGVYPRHGSHCLR
ncbi:hypothetical protein NDU88_008726 [Pleurodeles waltl]|uniref:Uncharacterized protein n=1 Tax=Pleurodeles waltl TaxID=8319 RepID=A0AAV7NZS4_PLEWA|nr:hypothetical protein NDU88_008726 [Pleurodeles waltl]